MDVRRALLAGLVGMSLLVPGCARTPDADAARSAVAARDLGAAQVFRGLVYARRDSGPLALDLYLPRRATTRTPFLVYAHGGGWDAGVRTLDADRGATEALTAQRLVERGYAVATVDYRLTGGAKAPAQVVDVADAVRWLQANAGRWNLDPDRVGLWGASAGGHLVAQLGAVAGDPAKPGGGLRGIRAVVDWFGPTDLSAEAQTAHPELTGYAKRVITELLGCLPVDCPAVADASSPIRNLSGDEPPFLLQQGTADSLVPVVQSLDFAAELRRRGVPVEMHPYEGLDHGFGRGPRTEPIADTVVAFVSGHV